MIDPHTALLVRFCSRRLLLVFIIIIAISPVARTFSGEIHKGPFSFSTDGADATPPGNAQRQV
jgi:hypothetical protein